MGLLRHNPHWTEGFFYPFEKKRFVFDQLLKTVTSNRVTTLCGMRGSGKSILIMQLINEMIKRGAKRDDILYLPFDEQNESLWALIGSYEGRSGRKLSENHVLFIDDIHRLKGWAEALMRVRALTNVRIVLSSSVDCGFDGLEGMPINRIDIGPLSFKEFLHLRDVPSIYDSSDDHVLEIAFKEYLPRPLPALAFANHSGAKAIIETLVRKTIFEDLPAAFPMGDPAFAHQLFSHISREPGLSLDYSSLSSKLGWNRHTIGTYIDYLEKGQLIRVLSNYSPGLSHGGKRLRKAYPTLSCFVHGDEHKILATSMAQVLKARYFWNQKGRYEVDFVLPAPLFACQVFSKVVGLTPDDLKAPARFRSVYPAAKTLVITKKREGISLPYYLLERHLEQTLISTSREPIII